MPCHLPLPRLAQRIGTQERAALASRRTNQGGRQTGQAQESHIGNVRQRAPLCYTVTARAGCSASFDADAPILTSVEALQVQRVVGRMQI